MAMLRKFVLASLTASSVVCAAGEWKEFIETRLSPISGSLSVYVDVDGIRKTSEGVSVPERIDSVSISNLNVSCAYSEIAHGNTSKKLAQLICEGQAANGEAEFSKWPLLEAKKSKDGGYETRIDPSSLRRIGNLGSAKQITRKSTRAIAKFDCKGYYLTQNGGWQTLDTTDKIATVPSGYISTERQISDFSCTYAETYGH